MRNSTTATRPSPFLTTKNSFKYMLDMGSTNIFHFKVQAEGLYICRVQLHNQQYSYVSRMIKVVCKCDILYIRQYSGVRCM
ncbi:hypothetical protein DPMN_001825 [Dreissena polymorpha]|uniref:Uncharacterized protein n=1 Tax=Dreissena polymorpha TaxID=45954 RepID=A0A9D4MKS7_DREPO|nr:hypothetical protein DPMN_001825 [Dreissena polymorpha]